MTLISCVHHRCPLVFNRSTLTTPPLASHTTRSHTWWQNSLWMVDQIYVCLSVCLSVPSIFSTTVYPIDLPLAVCIAEAPGKSFFWKSLVQDNCEHSARSEQTGTEPGTPTGGRAAAEGSRSGERFLGKLRAVIGPFRKGHKHDLFI